MWLYRILKNTVLRIHDSLLKDDEHPSIGLAICILKFTMSWGKNRGKFKSWLYRFFLFVSVILFIDQFILMLLVHRTDMYMNFIHESVFHLAIFKMLMYEMHHTKFEEFVGNLSQIEIEILKDCNCKNIVKSYTKYAHTVILSFLLICFTGYAQLLIQYWWIILIEILTGSTKEPAEMQFIFWLPINGALNVYLRKILLLLYSQITCAYIITSDSYALTSLIVIIGQLKVVRIRFRHALDDESEEIQRRNLINCFEQYLRIIEVKKLLNDMLSPGLLMKLFTITIGFGIIITKFTSSDETSLIVGMAYLFGTFSQLCFYYWHGNEVTVCSNFVYLGIYESNWIDKSAEIRRLVLMMLMATQKKLVFYAGPYTEVSLKTFISILRMSYSFYTLMNSTNNN